MMLLLFSSCENYLDVNEKQTNRPDFDALNPSQMLSGALNSYTSYQVGTLASYGNRLAYVWGLNSGFTSTDPAYTYKYDSSSYTACFESAYLIGDNFQDILDKKESAPTYTTHYGVAKVMKVMCMDYVTALYGDAPYTEAFNNNIIAPKYEDDKKIIPALFKELDEARAYFAAAGAEPMGAEDCVFGGDKTKWIKFVNTVELKILLRLSKTTDATLVALRTARFAALNASQNFVTQDVTVNPGYNNGTLASRSPLFRLYGQNESFSAATSANAANAAGDFAGRLVNGTINDANINSSGVVDPRRARMFTLIGGTVVGNVQGVFPLTAISKFASFFHGRTGASVDIANKNGGERNAFLMQAAESYFLQAEAMQRGYLTGSAKAAFDAGVTASFNFYSTGFGTIVIATPLNPVTYLAAIDAKNGLGWTGSTDKISAIMTQKYLALAQWHGIEVYIDHMRTGYPVLPLPFGVTETKRPNRLIYPSSEYSSNSANTPIVSNADLFTVNAKTPYYLQ